MLFRTSAPHLTLIIPGLTQALAALANEGFRLPQLERLVGRANSEVVAIPSYEALLFALFGLGKPGAKDIPLAAVMYPWDKGRALSESGWWLRADPVHLQADRDRVLLFGARYIALNRAEAGTLASVVAPLLAELGGQLEVLHPERWYLRLPQPEAVTFTALSAVEGKYIEPGLPAGPDSSRWRTLLNEIQMTLHDCPANREREERGDWPINSLWFWGAGEAPVCPALSWRQAGWGREPLLQALARYCGVPGRPALTEANTWLTQNSASGNYLLVLDSLLPAMEPMHYRAALLALDKDWLGVLFKALQHRDLASLTLYPMDGRCYHLTWSRTWYLWRRSRPLVAWS